MSYVFEVQCNFFTSNIYAMKILNLYAGVGGNIELIDDVEHDITNVELDPKIAAVLQRRKPRQEVVVGDAPAYLLNNYDRFDFIWSSRPCQTHTRMVKFSRHKPKSLPDMGLYSEIVFLEHFFGKPGKYWVVENVMPYYTPLIKPSKVIGRHLFWSNFEIQASDVERPDNFINTTNVAGKKALMEWLGIHYEENIYYAGNHCPAQVLRNCVHPKLGLQIFQSIDLL